MQKLSARRTVLVGLLLLGSPAWAQSLLPPDDAAKRGVVAAGAPRATARIVHPDPTALEASEASGHLTLPSTDARPLSARFVSLDRREDGLRVWVGRVTTDLGPQSAVIVMSDNGLTQGLVPQRRGPPIRIETRHGRTWLLEGEEPGHHPASSSDDAGRSGAPDAGSLAKRARQESHKSHGGAVIDLGVIYSTGLVEAWGSHEAVLARIALLEAITNQAYRDSNVGAHVRVVARHLLDYRNANDNQQALEEMRAGGGSQLRTEVLRMQQDHGADLVMLLREYDPANQTNCGYGYILGYHGSGFDDDRGLSVTSDRGFAGAACGVWTFAHELGHNLGSEHDFETAEGNYGAYAYSRGYRQTLGPDSGFATVMAYSQTPQQVIGQFSNPLLSRCLSVPCGDAASADNGRGMSQSAPIIAAFRSPPAAPLPMLSVLDAAVEEGSSGVHSLVFTVQLSQPAAETVRFTLATRNGTAQSGQDFLNASANLNIAPGATSATLAVSVRGDTLVELDEYFTLGLSAVTGARVARGQAIGTIRNDEAIPTISIGDAQRVEGDAGGSDLVFPVTLSAPSAAAVVFTARTSGFVASPTSATSDTDFASSLQPDLVIPAGQAAGEVRIALLGDTAPEQDESFILRISGVRGAVTGDDYAIGVITDDDGGMPDLPRISVADAAIQEGNAGSRAVEFVISLSAPSAGPVVFDIVTGDWNAYAGEDFVSRAETGVVIPAGQTELRYPVQVLGDTRPEPEERFFARISNVSGAGILDARGFANIGNDDLDPAILAAIADRVVLLENAAATAIDVLANDAFDPARLAGGSLAIVQPPLLGSANIQANGAGTADDRIRYQPNADTSGDDHLVYRICEAAGACAQGRLDLVLRPHGDVAVASERGAGHQDLALTGLRALPSLRFETTALVPATVDDRALAADPTPLTPWDATGIGTGHVTDLLPAAGDASALTWRLLVDARAIGSGDIDLYLGIDDDGDGKPQADELRCTAAMSSGPERCEMQLVHPGTGSVRYWAMVHNRSPGVETARLQVFAVPLRPGDTRLVATGPGRLDAGEDFRVRVAWSDPALLPGEAAAGFVRLRHGNGVDAGLFPVRIDRSDDESAARPLASGVPLLLRLGAGHAQERTYIDVPQGASSLAVATTSAANIDLYLARSDAPGSPVIAAAPARASAQASAQGATGNEQLVLSGGQLSPGRWYVTPVNADAAPATVQLSATVTGVAPLVRSGSYFNPARSGHGLFLYPAGGQWAGLWYTYFQDGSPTWYYLQGAAPDANGLWSAGLYRAAWNGSGNHLTEVGRATVAPTGADAFVFSYTVDGETGSEPMAALGRGCPSLAGAPLDVSSHWFNPAKAGTGYSVQLFPAYEFYAAFVYDGQGVPRFLTAERNGFGGADATLQLDQLTGFCPLCVRTGNPSRLDVGSLRRRFANGSFAGIELDAIYGAGVAGAWTANETIQVLGGPGTTQGCAMP